MSRRNRPRNFPASRDPAARPGASVPPPTVTEGAETAGSATVDPAEETEEAEMADEPAAETTAPDPAGNIPATVATATAEATTTAEEPTTTETTTVPHAVVAATVEEPTTTETTTVLRAAVAATDARAAVGVAAAEPSHAPTVSDTPEPMPPRPVWRTIAIAKQARQVYFGGVLTAILGGELIAYPPHVAALRGDSAFEFIDVASPEELEAIRERHERAIAALRDLARALGFVVYRDGETPRSK